jgi:ribosomal protein S12 methylthiotransferase
VSGGVHEIILIGQDTGLWAYDFAQNADAAARSAQTGRAEPGGAATKDTAKEGEPSPQNLAQLLDALATAYPRTWFRVMYLQPQGISDDLLDVMARHHTLCNYLDIPLQHANARILADMNRSGSTHDYTKLLARIRKVLPNVVLRTTLIAGFPGEGRHEADELVRFVEQADFDYVGVFAYSQEDGTQAGMRSDQVPLRTRKARQQRLRDAADVAGFARASEYVGSTVEVLVCGEDEEGVYGRTQGQAPDVDGIVHIEDITLDDARAQGIVQVHIAEAVCYDLYGRVVTLNV